MRLIDADHLKKWMLARWQERNPQTDKPFKATEIFDQIDREMTFEGPPERKKGRGWIPVTEKPPKDDEEVIVSCTDDSGDHEFSYTTTGWHFNGTWVVGNERSYFVRAWMPLPKPYEGRERVR